VWIAVAWSSDPRWSRQRAKAADSFSRSFASSSASSSMYADMRMASHHLLAMLCTAERASQ